ncbi:MAG: DUF2298 domain-containing protein, partial [Anaerolineae bacterium]|nr:DUF2298 domain-containing protein [Anaerolineae bacterium]
MTVENMPSSKKPLLNFNRSWGYEILLILILLVGAYFRFVGQDWGTYQIPHPDERFLTQVESNIAPVESLSEYFNTEKSSLNPSNRGHKFFVYGTLPIVMIRYLAEWVGQVGYGEATIVGRQLGALMDLLVVFLVFLTATRLYDKRVGLVAAAFSAFTVLQIQLSHYMVVDPFINFFAFLSIYIAVLIATSASPDQAARVAVEEGQTGIETEPSSKAAANAIFNIWIFVAFGAALGMAMASKISAAPLALMLPAAVVVRMSRLSLQERSRYSGLVFNYLVLAAAVSLLSFRIFQPYAFSGPGFFGVRLNPEWLQTMTNLRNQVTGDVDWPPSIQWARRPVWFSFQNMVLWGFGLPMGIMAWGGFLWAGWRMLKGEWRRHALLWGWTTLYFTWQSMAFNPTMRYQLPVYPALAVVAGWAVIALWDAAAAHRQSGKLLSRIAQPAAAFVGSAALVATFLWAWSFSNIYTRQETREQASYWIFQNLLGPVNLPIESDGEITNQLVPFQYSQTIQPNVPFLTAFTAQTGGTIAQVNLNHILTPVYLTVYDAEYPDVVLFRENMLETISSTGSNGYQQLELLDFRGLTLNSDQNYMLRIELPAGAGSLSARALVLEYTQLDNQSRQVLPLSSSSSGGVEYYQTNITLPFGGRLESLHAELAAEPKPVKLSFALASTPDMVSPLAVITQSVDVSTDPGMVGQMVSLSWDPTVELSKGELYYIQIALQENVGEITLRGAAVANETGWDLGLPARVSGYDGFGGIFQPGMTFELYWEDNPDKLQRFYNILDRTEYIFISSSRQWANIPRIPERFPLTAQYFRALIGCPEEKTIEWCYNVAGLDTFTGNLGFDLVTIIKSDPNIGSFQINDQFSEEAFTVYDHPKVFIFRKNPNYDPAGVRAILGAVDLTSVVHLTPKQASKYDATPEPTLLLPEERLAAQQQGGTWAQLFNRASLLNSSHPVVVLVWYLSVALLGLLVYPLTRAAFSGLSDRGYPLSRILGLLLLSYLSWLPASLGLSFSRTLIASALAVLAVSGAVMAYRQREVLLLEWRQNRRYFLRVEALFLVFFLAGLLIRLGNPDLWHASFGGEKPMDFSYFNAVLKSTSFPPYDPWFAGGYINYYYYGFVIVGTLVKLLGIIPAIAYNLILPTLFSLMAMGAFSVGWNLLAHRAVQAGEDEDAAPAPLSPWLGGIAAALILAVLGNLGTF